MMTEEQVRSVKLVYARFIESEDVVWNDIDENLEFAGYLTDKELVVECLIKCSEHSQSSFRCSQNHKVEHCMAPIILDAVIAILDLYEETKELHPKNKYILQYYLAMSALLMIYNG